MRTPLLFPAAVALLTFASPALAKTFTVVALPDTQFYSQDYPAILQKQTQWILENREKENIVFVTHEGDIVNDNVPEQWKNATAGMYILDKAKDLPWGTVAGNHDQRGGSLQNYIERFGRTHFEGKTWYGGANDGSSFLFFKAGGRTYLALQLQYDASESVLYWAQAVLDTYSDLPVIVTTHDYMDGGGRTPYGDMLFENFIRKNPSIFAVLAGHMHTERNQISMNDEGQPVIELLADYQDRTNGGNGYLRLYRFDEENAQLTVQTYSPVTGEFLTGDGSQFVIPLNFEERLGPKEEDRSLPVLAAIATGLVLAGFTARILLRRSKPPAPLAMGS